MSSDDDFRVRWEPVSRHSSMKNAREKTTKKKKINPSDTLKTPSSSSTRTTRPSLLSTNSTPTRLHLTKGTPRTMVPLGSPRWSPRLNTSKENANATRYASSQSLLTEKAPTVYASGVSSVQVDNGSERQRIYFIGGKSTTMKEPNAPLDILALDIDEPILGSECEPVVWRRFIAKDSYVGHCSPRVGHVSVCLESTLKETHLDRFEKNLNAGEKHAALESKYGADTIAAASTSDNYGKFIYVFGGELLDESYMLNDMFRILVWRKSDREPEGVGRWEKVTPSSCQPCARRGASAVAITNSEMLMFGGYSNVCEEDNTKEGKGKEAKEERPIGKTLNDVWIFNSYEVEWRQMNDYIDGEHPPTESAYHHSLIVPGTEEESSKHQLIGNNWRRDIPGTIVSQVAFVGIECITVINEAKSGGEEENDDEKQEEKNSKNKNKNKNTKGNSKKKSKKEVKVEEEEEDDKKEILNDNQKILTERFKYLYILSVIVGEDELFQSKEEKTNDADNDDEAVRKRMVFNEKKKKNLNGFIWKWDRINCVPGLSKPLERCWFGCCFGELMLSTTNVSPQSKTLKGAMLLLEDINKMIRYFNSEDREEEEEEAFNEKVMNILNRKYKNELLLYETDRKEEEETNNMKKKNESTEKDEDQNYGKKGGGKKKKKKKVDSNNIEVVNGTDTAKKYTVLLLKLLNESKNDTEAVIRNEENVAAPNTKVRPSNRIIVYGGRSPLGLAQQDLWSIDINTGMFNTCRMDLSSTMIPHPRFGHTMVNTKNNTRIVLFGGSDGRNRLSDAQVLKLQISPKVYEKNISDSIQKKSNEIVQNYSPSVYCNNNDDDPNNDIRDGDDGAILPIFGSVQFGKAVSKDSSTHDDSAKQDNALIQVSLKGSYLGDWDDVNNCPHGQYGKAKWLYNGEEESYEGSWSNGERLDGTNYYSESNGGGKFTGTYNTTDGLDRPCGNGRRTYSSRHVPYLVSYDGNWKNGQWYGQGTVTYSNEITCTAGHWGGGDGDGDGQVDNSEEIILSKSNKYGFIMLSDLRKNANFWNVVTIDYNTKKERLTVEDSLTNTYLGDVLFPFDTLHEHRNINSVGSASSTSLPPYVNIPLKHGKGIMYFKDGSMYEGNYWKDKRHGNGKMEYKNGTTYTGEWRNDQWNGKGALKVSVLAIFTSF
jgi:hypothetical protein